MTQTTAIWSKPITDDIFLFLLPFVIYLSGCYLFFKMPCFLKSFLWLIPLILCSDSHKFLKEIKKTNRKKKKKNRKEAQKNLFVAYQKFSKAFHGL